MKDAVVRLLGPLRFEIYQNSIVVRVIEESDSMLGRLTLDWLAKLTRELEDKGIPHETCLKDTQDGEGKEPDAIIFKLKGEQRQ